MTYAAGFAAGEAQAFKDRRNGVRQARQDARSEYERGWWDGYMPRDPAWALQRPPAQAWWQERETEAV